MNFLWNFYIRFHHILWGKFTSFHNIFNFFNFFKFFSFINFQNSKKNSEASENLAIVWFKKCFGQVSSGVPCRLYLYHVICNINIFFQFLWHMNKFQFLHFKRICKNKISKARYICNKFISWLSIHFNRCNAVSRDVFHKNKTIFIGL